MLKLAERFAENETGGTAIEYALVASGIFLAIVTVIGQIGTTLNLVFTSVNDGFQ